ncbi:MAG: preprotein translocase subunit SecG [Saprospiraceae bacterium]|nr:preprotein translocase subunit SecG [Bacteroidia bacterium]MBT8230749.1 preprotein translocase subunit SecG [Bacteroidia bacterium]NNF22067.1 preprotein translocase subunit SecG [Saprospiraceae bacterium]NNK89295.1 preprotein translocase subunit SecG [Saprospiraceae bacterium]
MITALTILIALNAFMLMAVVLIQNPKGGGIDSTFGGQGANQMFGAARSTDFIEKLTWGLAISMFVLAIITAIIVSNSAGAGGGIPLQSAPGS